MAREGVVEAPRQVERPAPGERLARGEDGSAHGEKRRPHDLRAEGQLARAGPLGVDPAEEVRHVLGRVDEAHLILRGRAGLDEGALRHARRAQALVGGPVLALLEDVDALRDVLRSRALEFKDTLMIGRTHGVHAEPITFGLKLALWWDEMNRNRGRLVAAREQIAVGKVSGVVTTLAIVNLSTNTPYGFQAGSLGPDGATNVATVTPSTTTLSVPPALSGFVMFPASAAVDLNLNTNPAGTVL
ncbi:MAG: hypothetical protein HYY66_06855, partial [Candidatus Tectomicrobia bacterium]|nr:hypothetical protein [Candidatus Tectomicrobia bacterium]